MIKELILTIFAIFAFGLLFTPTLYAQEQNNAESNITAFPALLEASLDAGETYKTNLVLVNNSDKPLPVSIEVKSLIPSEYIIDLSKRSQFDASRWIKVEPTNLALEAGETKRIKLEVIAPQEATPGGHYAEIVIKQLVLDTNSTTNQNETKLIPQLKVPVLLNVNGDATDELIIEKENHFPSFIQKFSSINTEVTIANTGTTHLLPSIKIEVFRGGEIIQTEDFSPGIILPNTKRDYYIKWNPVVPVGIYDMKVSVAYGEESLILNSEPERVIIFFPILLIIGLFAVSGITGFLLAKRKNIKDAFNVLKNSSKTL